MLYGPLLGRLTVEYIVQGNCIFMLYGPLLGRLTVEYNVQGNCIFMLYGPLFLYHENCNSLF